MKTVLWKHKEEAWYNLVFVCGKGSDEMPNLGIKEMQEQN